MYDVIEVNLQDKTVQVIAESKTLRNAEAIIDMAVIRRGVEDSFYTYVTEGAYKTGDTYGVGITD